MRLISALLLLAFAAAGFSAEASTAINYDIRQSGFKFNNATQLTLSATEQNVVFTAAPGYPVIVQFAQGSSTNSWTYSLVTGDSTQTTTVAAGQNLILVINPATTTIYLKSASGVTLSISCLTYIVRNQ